MEHHHHDPAPQGSTPTDAAGEPAGLVIGPLLRYVDESRATIWVETERPCVVTVRAGEVSSTASTWTVHGHHYALVVLDHLPRCTSTPYTVELDDVEVWPPPDSPFPPSAIRTPDFASPYRLAFGSCRRSAPFDQEYFETIGADALVALATRMLETPTTSWPDLLMMIGDQVYADDPSAAIAERLEVANRDADPEVAGEIQDFEQYTWLYAEAWAEPTVRWLLSTVPSGMLLDDHDLRDDWNSSKSWRDEVTATGWWHDRVIGAYGSYWVYQHLGNLSPEQLETDDVYRQLREIADDDERTHYLDGVAWEADVDASSIRFSFYRDLGGAGRGVRLVAIDSRCSRQLDPEDRRMVDPDEWAWVREQVLQPEHAYEHLVLASTLPFLMLPGVHHMEGWDEAVAQGAWGRVGKWLGERIRLGIDLEHWAAFRNSFAEFTDLLTERIAAPEPPASVLLLGGDVHCSYTAAAHLTTLDHPGTRIHQLTMSPFRNDIERAAKRGNELLNRRRVSRAMRRLARLAKVDDVPIEWQVDHGVWFDNGVMTVEFIDGNVGLTVDHAEVEDDGTQRLHRTLDVALAGDGAPASRVAS